MLIVPRRGMPITSSGMIHGKAAETIRSGRIGASIAAQRRG
jgi:hypothetical protein